MGHQVNYFMLGEDTQEFEEMLKARGDVAFVPYVFLENAVKTVPTLNIMEAGRPEFMLWLARHIDIPQITLQFVPQQLYWLVDEERSPVVQLHKSIIKGQTILRGRLYFYTGYYDRDGRWVAKPDDFIRWADGLIRWIRRHYVVDPKTKFYVGPHAWQCFLEGKCQLKAM